MNLSEQQKIRIGTCAWSFEEWSGSLYPPDLPQNRWLEFYARYFPAVEIDSTFYSAPAEEVAQRWVEMTPPHFRFTCKLPREITHHRHLRDCSAELKTFLHLLEPLAPSDSFAPLVTERLILRPLIPEDAAALHKLVNDFEVARNLSVVPFPYPRELADEWIESTRHTFAAGLGDMKKYVSYGASPRASIALVTGARALAFLHGRL